MVSPDSFYFMVWENVIKINVSISGLVDVVRPPYVYSHPLASMIFHMELFVSKSPLLS
jgi:hypothetical protein